MKKIISSVFCLLLALSLTACGSSKAQEVKNVCKLEDEGQVMVNEIYSTEDVVSKVIYNVHTDAALLEGFTQDELDTIVATAQNTYSEIPGCTYSFEQNDQGIDEVITLVYSSDTIPQLVQLGMITAASQDAGEIQFVSLEATIAQMTSEGFTCE